ncbi:MAG: iron chelate uptake ABC transporter family permease subunit [Actinomycetota bacterium]
MPDLLTDQRSSGDGPIDGVPARTSHDAIQRRRRLDRRSVLVFVLLSLIAAGSATLFLTWGVNGYWDYALPRRLEQLAALVVVGAAISVSTIVFQTLTENRILTPAIMGFDALYILIATTLVFMLGSETVVGISSVHLFALNAILLVVVATLAYRWVLTDTSRGLYTLLLVGVIAGTLFNSFSTFMFRVMEPSEYDTLLTTLYASFNLIDTTVLRIATALLVLGIVAAVMMAPTLDVLTLGRDRATALGVDYRRTATKLLIIVAGLVAVSTALVGPVLFLGLLVANLAYQLTRTQRHSITLPAAILISITALALGQALLQHVFNYAGTLGSIINLVGGTYFVILLVMESKKT